MDFNTISSSIVSLHNDLRGAVAGAASRFLTMRNWIIGMYIVEYEQNGEDRAQYGAEMLKKLAERLCHSEIKGMSLTNLKLFRTFFLSYPMLSQSIIKSITQMLSEIGQKPSDLSSILPQIRHLTQRNHSLLLEERQPNEYSPNAALLLRHFSFSHFVELMRIDDPLKRAFYEIEGIKGCWSVPQLKRQIESLLYERTGLSKDKKGLLDSIHAKNQVITIEDTIRDPYILEFSGFPESAQFSENDLETALLDHIQSFLLELGNGFCFEARQKRITIDNEHDRIDLVFYHRIVRCHVLIDLKVRKFRHADAGQMNFYLNYFRENIMQQGDNPPVGLILCTHRDETMVRYATGGLDNKLFVSKYLSALPSEETIRAFLADDRDRTELRVMEQRAVYGTYAS